MKRQNYWVRFTVFLAIVFSMIAIPTLCWTPAFAMPTGSPSTRSVSVENGDLPPELKELTDSARDKIDQDLPELDFEISPHKIYDAKTGADITPSDLEIKKIRRSNFIGDAISALAAFKKVHGGQEALQEAKANVRRLKALLKDPNSDLSIAIKNSQTFCAQANSKSICANALKLERLQIENALNNRSTGSSSTWNFIFPQAFADHNNANGFACLSDPDAPHVNTQYHALLYGQANLTTCEDDRKITISTFGPGVFGGIPNVLGSCSHSPSGKNFGVLTGIGALVSVSVGLYIGEGGVCTLLETGAGFGAYAGISVLKFND